jgi:acetyl esterase/lipase
VVPLGYLFAVGLVGTGMVLALRPLGRSRRLGKISWLVSTVPNESPFLAFYWVVSCTLLALVQGDLDSPLAWAGLAFAGVSFIGAPIIVMRSLRARPAIDRALEEGLGRDWRDSIDRTGVRPAPGPLPWFRILIAPLPLFRGGVRRFANIAYGDAGRQNRLDLYRHRSRPSGGPILIHLHGGRFRTGRKSFEARPLLHGLARHGWVCISANYRLQPSATFPDYLVDVKKVIRWAREHANEHGADPTQVFVAGSSAGAHLAASAALTANDPTFQRGFEHADTTVAAAIGLYGYYGPVDRDRQPLRSSPADYAHPDAPPLLIVHGDQDTYVPPEHAREFVERARRSARGPVVYAELPGAQHSFDLFHSIRFETVIDGIEAFAAWVRAQPARSAGHHASDRERAAG